jgi:phosphoglycolate phosphatase
MSPPLLVFDLDGTLVDSAPDLIATLAAVLPRHGFSFEPDPRLRDGIGHGARHLIEYALHRQNAAADKAIVDVLHRDFLAHYEENICVGSACFPGGKELLARFAAAGWSLAICTNKPERLSRLLLARLDIADRFAAVCGGDTFANRKPHPAHLLRTVMAAGGSPTASIMVGDSRTDLDTARAARLPFVGVSFGYTPVPMATLGPDLIVEHFDELTPAAAERLLDGGAQRAAGSARP